MTSLPDFSKFTPKRLHRRRSSAFNTLIQHHTSHTSKTHSRHTNTAHKFPFNRHLKMLISVVSRRGLWFRVLAIITVFLLVLWISLPNEMGKKSFSDLKGWKSTEESMEQSQNDPSSIPLFTDKETKQASDRQKHTGVAADEEDSLSGQLRAPAPHTSDHCDSPTPGRPAIQYALMIDAGSTGSRIHVYRFNYCKSTPELEDEVFEKTEPGLSSYKDDPLAAAKSLDGLMQVALDNVPKDLYDCTPIAVKATAGLRLLGENQSKNILKAVRNRLEKNYPFPIHGGPSGVEIMDGRDEGVYAWTTVNYLLGNLHSKNSLTAGVFDLGGASTQIVFEPAMEESKQLPNGDHRYELSFGGRKFVLYQNSYLSYGLKEARKGMTNYLIKQWRSDAAARDNEVHDPCLPLKHVEEVQLNESVRGYRTVRVVGTGAGFAACRAVAEQILNKEKECPLAPCSFNGTYQPSLEETFHQHDIYAFSYFYDLTYPLGMPSEFSVRELRELTDDVCKGETRKFAHVPGAEAELRGSPNFCKDLSFIYTLLHTGYGIPEDRMLKIAKKIRGAETGWCLGASLAMLDEKKWCKA
ncbi:uncharacterized protein VTP21DRAFT_9891 [Calcarisporiella thermophila]|uniref:uncharacterized protein n=1 Tax=Calcarisporiella thermophila TaxID=911321 RepID=UPI0037441B10